MGDVGMGDFGMAPTTTRRQSGVIMVGTSPKCGNGVGGGGGGV